MALEDYNRKRDFRKTPEPSGASGGKRAHAISSAARSFVIQKHAARRLHYDFRLELDGVLKSWAVPKGPSLDPGEKRLAVHVEDHPVGYGGFEGIIPAGQYGGGTVLLWDKGNWSPLDADPAAAYGKGVMKFTLDGNKLHGAWTLIRMGGKAAKERQENWLLIKERDETAVAGSKDAIVAENPLSVASGRSIEEIALEKDRVWQSRTADDPGGEAEPVAAAEKPQARKTSSRAGKAKSPGKADAEVADAAVRASASARSAATARAALPDDPRPMLATAVAAPPQGSEWLHELKYDGYRIMARIERGDVRLLTRSGLDWTAKFPEQAKAFAALAVETALIDGELVHLDEDGTTRFSGLQDDISSGRTQALVYYAFDLLHRDGADLTPFFIEARKAALLEIVPADAAGLIRFSDHQAGRGEDFFRHACNFALEGIVSKRRDKPYRPGRSDNWLKSKCINREEFLIVGFTEPAGTRSGLGALLLGYHDPSGALRYAGRVGTGFSAEQLDRMHDRLAAIEVKIAPVALPAGVSRRGVHWVSPDLVAEIRFGTWTADALLRHATFEGLREDKPPEEVVHDPAGKAGKAPAKPAAAPAPPGEPRRESTRSAKKASQDKATGIRALPEAEIARDGSTIVEGVRVTNAKRVMYPEQAITKRDLALYYAAIADWALPHVAHRALSLVRCPEGQGKQCFYQKHVGAGVPDAIARIEIPLSSGKSETYLVIRDAAGLIGTVQMGVLEIHPWGSAISTLETPDRITFDFDPDEGLPWSRVTEAAVEMRAALQSIGLESFAKTTGGKGLHVVVPIRPTLDWNAVKAFTKAVADSFVAAYPDRFTANMAKRARQGRIFIDYLRNGRGATAVAAYSVRARPGAPVSTPISWAELENGIAPGDFTLATVPKRLAGLDADPWDGMLTLKQAISAAATRKLRL